MGISIGNEVNAQNAILNNLYSSVRGVSSQFLNTGTREFASILKENFDSIDENADNKISKEELAKADIRNQELKKLIDNKNIEKTMADIDTDKDGVISFSEVNPESNVPNILKSALREIQTTQNFGTSTMNLAKNLCRNYYATPAMTNLTTNAISALM